MTVFEQFRKLSGGRKLILAAGALAVPLVGFAQVAFVLGGVFEGGQKFGIVVTSWTALILAATFAWKAAG
jgi:hypothetical protein